MYKVIKGTTSTVESELNKLSANNNISIKSTGVIGDLIVVILFINPRAMKAAKKENPDSSKETNKSKSTKNSGTKSTKSK